jgi:hypothetical protein
MTIIASLRATLVPGLALVCVVACGSTGPDEASGGGGLIPDYCGAVFDDPNGGEVCGTYCATGTCEGNEPAPTCGGKCK